MKHMQSGNLIGQAFKYFGLFVILLAVGWGIAQIVFPSNRGEKNSSSASATSSQVSRESDSSKDKSNVTKKNKNWDSQQTVSLQKFMKRWGNGMHQHYTGTTGKTELDYYGMKIPTDLKRAKLLVNGKAITASWTTNIKPRNQYQFVAAYTNASSTADTAKYLYLFGYYQRKPIVLVTAQSQDAKQGLNFKVTENQDLKVGFHQIAEDGKTNLLVSTAKTSSTSDNFYQTKWTYKASINFLKRVNQVAGNDNSPFDLNLVSVSQAKSSNQFPINLIPGNSIYLDYNNKSGAGDGAFVLTKNSDQTVTVVIGSGAMAAPFEKLTINSQNQIIDKTQINGNYQNMLAYFGINSANN